MMTPRDPVPNTALMSLEAAAATARAGFACMFSSSDEYETALISARRAEGRYGAAKTQLPLLAFISCCAMIVVTVVWLA